jgi:hypothetical protein
MLCPGTSASIRLSMPFSPRSARVESVGLTWHSYGLFLKGAGPYQTGGLGGLTVHVRDPFIGYLAGTDLHHHHVEIAAHGYRSGYVPRALVR